MIGAHRNPLGEMQMRRDESPLRRTNPGGEVRWVARYTAKDGKRRSAGTFEKKGPCRRPAAGCCAQHAIYAAYEADKDGTARHTARGTVGDYATGTWLQQHPRAERSNARLETSLRATLDLNLGDGPLRAMLFADVERRHAVKLVDTLLRAGRAVNGVKVDVAALSGMWQDALDDGWTKTANPFMRLKIRHNDPRVIRERRETVVLTFPQMWSVSAAAGNPRRALMIRLLSDCGLRLGEMLPLHALDVKLRAGACDETACRVTGPHVHVRRNAWQAREFPGTKTGARTVPLSAEVADMLRAHVSGAVPLIGDALLFPTRSGSIWWERDFYGTVWYPAVKAAGLQGVTPHMFRHSWVSAVRAAGVDVADAAAAAGHSVDTATRVYTHDLGRSADAIRRVVGE